MKKGCEVILGEGDFKDQINLTESHRNECASVYTHLNIMGYLKKETLSTPHQNSFIFTWRDSGGSSTMAFAKEFSIPRYIIQFLELIVFTINTSKKSYLPRLISILIDFQIYLQ